MENKIILPYWLLCRWRLKSYIKSVAVEIDFPCIYSTKSEGEKGGVGGGAVIPAWPYIREKYSS